MLTDKMTNRLFFIFAVTCIILKIFAFLYLADHLNSNTKISVYCFRKHQGSGKHVNARAVNPEVFYKKTQGIRRVCTTEGTHVCLAAAIIFGHCNSWWDEIPMDMSGSKKGKVITRLTRAATNLSPGCDVIPNYPRGHQGRPLLYARDARRIVLRGPRKKKR